MNWMARNGWGGAAVLVAVAACVLLAPFPGDASERVIRVVGSTTMGPMVREMIVAYRQLHPDAVFSLTGSGSKSGAQALASGAAEVALLSRGMTREETVASVRSGVVPMRIILALDALVPIVHPDNPVSDLSLEQIRAIYTGEVRNWKELGGPDLAVEPFGRTQDSGTHDIWQFSVMAATPEMDGLERVESSTDMVRAARDRAGAIGYVPLGFVDETVRALRIDGSEATPGSVVEDSYPASRTLNVYISRNASPEVRAFVEFTLSESARPLIEGAGFIPAAQE